MVIVRAQAPPSPSARDTPAAAPPRLSSSQHLLGILAFSWLSTVLHNANIRMRRQVMLKEVGISPSASPVSR